jgi:HEAT repeat protein
VSGGPSKPGVPGTPGGQGRAAFSFDDAWYIWWEYNKDGYLYRDRLSASEAAAAGGTKTSGPRAALKRSYVEQTVIPLLTQVLQKGSNNRELISGSLIALARLKPKDEVIPTIARYLKENQEFSETAALALGITGSKAALPILLSLAADNKEGAQATGHKRVHYRTRSFALYGIGIWCQQSKDNYQKLKVLPTLLTILGKESRRRDKNLRQDSEVAALQALRLLAPGSKDTSGDLLRKDAIEFLLKYMASKDKKASLLRSHAVSALGGVLGRHEDPTGKALPALLDILDDRRAQAWVHQSAILSLGQVGAADDSELLKRLSLYMRKGKDRHARHLASVSIGRIGSDEAREFLLKSLPKAKTQDRTWIALGLGVLDDVRRTRTGSKEVDRTIGDSLLQISRKVKMKANRSGLAIAMGIQGYRPAGPMIAAWIQPRIKNMFNAYFAESLGLLRAKSAQDTIRDLADRSVRHPGIFAKAVLALGQLRDPAVAPFLVDQLRSQNSSLVQASLAQALGNVGGEREADQLVEIVGDRKERDIVRGFAAVALGLMGEPTKLPWHYQLSSGINYLAQSETLVGGGMGVLEIL